MSGRVIVVSRLTAFVGRIPGVRLAVVCGLCVALTAPSARACVQVDECDNFAPPGTAPIVLTPALDLAINGPGSENCTVGHNPAPCGPTGPSFLNSLQFDQIADDWVFGYSFLDLSDLCCPATLEITVKASTTLPGTDSLSLDSEAGLRWGAFLNGLDAATSLCTHAIGTADGTWSGGEVMTCVFDLCALPCSPGGTPFNCIGALPNVPTIDLTPNIHTSTVLSVAIQDDTAVDCIGLCHNVCPFIPTVSEWGLIVMLLAGLSMGTVVFARRRRSVAA